MPTITKLYELVLLNFVKLEVKEKNMITPKQRGFVESYSTYDNIVDLIYCMTKSERI